jgi:hypothetical protein
MFQKRSKYLRTAAAASLLATCVMVCACSERSNREDFATRLKGKTEQEVLTNAGKPATVDNTQPEHPAWTYTSRTFDVQNQNKFDAKTVVIFSRSSEGKLVVSEVRFEND